MIMWLFIGSWTFSSVFSYLGGHEIFEHFFTSIEISTWQFLIITQVIIFLLGWPLEWTEILIIFVPIFLPLLEVFNVNPYFFAKKYGLTLNTSSRGKNIGTNIIKISVHSNGHPKRKIIT